MADTDQKKNFWTSLPGILTGVTGVLTAFTGLYAVLHQIPQVNNTEYHIEKKDERTTTDFHQTPVPELVRWGPLDEQKPGICIDGSNEFIPWLKLKEEIQQRLLPQVGEIQVNSKVVLQDYAGRRDWIVRVVGATDSDIVHIWFGGNPENNWSHDGLIRIGTPNPLKIFGTYQRYSDGSYRKLTQ